MKATLPMLTFLVLLSGCCPKFDERVMVIEKTRTYHRSTCAQIMMARATEETRTEAREKGYRPCQYCRPDQ